MYSLFSQRWSLWQQPFDICKLLCMCANFVMSSRKMLVIMYLACAVYLAWRCNFQPATSSPLHASDHECKRHVTLSEKVFSDDVSLP